MTEAVQEAAGPAPAPSAVATVTPHRPTVTVGLARALPTTGSEVVQDTARVSPGVTNAGEMELEDGATTDVRMGRNRSATTGLPASVPVCHVCSRTPQPASDSETLKGTTPLASSSAIVYDTVYEVPDPATEASPAREGEKNHAPAIETPSWSVRASVMTSPGMASLFPLALLVVTTALSTGQLFCEIDCPLNMKSSVKKPDISGSVCGSSAAHGPKPTFPARSATGPMLKMVGPATVATVVWVATTVRAGASPAAPQLNPSSFPWVARWLPVRPSDGRDSIWQAAAV
mmetsp:Transcript_2198/g.7818  ORF Transcript_2198/g.7818 Transcript_2198/m.7818 type:complete len:288 (+) Transcript_2198:2055-2918(+)